MTVTFTIDGYIGQRYETTFTVDGYIDEPEQSSITAYWTSQKLDMGTNNRKLFSGLLFETNTACDITIWVWVDDKLAHDALTLSITNASDQLQKYQGIFGRGREIQVKFQVVQTEDIQPVIQGLSILYTEIK